MQSYFEDSTDIEKVFQATSRSVVIVGKMKSEEQNLNWYLSKSCHISFHQAKSILTLIKRDENDHHESLTDCISTIKEFVKI